ncbi:MAG TPA: vWA domain-containing protein [Candidatus Angelobacter sp.]|jgi:hypothetical protein|nr:vWA domain-containing protein [Candidatus Angelobacter sp.]
MNMRNVFFALLLAACLVGCGKQAQTRHIIILIDASGSIDRQALDQAFKAIDDLVGNLRRGDRIAIIPILGDAEAEASGRIIRFQIPTSRQAYDSDLKAFRQKLKTSLATMEAEAVAHPGSKSDILGSVALTEGEFQSDSGGSRRLLAVLSDFIQEDTNVNFKKDKRLVNPVSAKKFATQHAKQKSFNFRGMPVYLGLLRSQEYAAMEQSRRDAIQEFWIRLFKSFGAQPLFIADGSGLLRSFGTAFPTLE